MHWQGKKICVSTCHRQPENGCGQPENGFGQPENDFWSSSWRPETFLWLPKCLTTRWQSLYVNGFLKYWKWSMYWGGPESVCGRPDFHIWSSSDTQNFRWIFLAWLTLLFSRIRAGITVNVDIFTLYIFSRNSRFLNILENMYPSKTTLVIA